MALVLLPKESIQVKSELNKAEEYHKLRLLKRKRIKPLAKLLVTYTFEHYTDSESDRGYECYIMDCIWSGCDYEHISGARTLDELTSNTRLMNYVCERLMDKLCYKSLGDWDELLFNLGIGGSK